MYECVGVRAAVGPRSKFLPGGQTTDAGLKHLKELKDLRWLLLDGRNITDAGLKELKQALPEAKITIGP
jgi:hypothetical protein